MPAEASLAAKETGPSFAAEPVSFFFFPLFQFRIRVEGPVEVAVVPVQAVVQVGRKFARRARPAVARAADPADHVARFDDPARFHRFVEAAQMRVVMVDVVDAPDADPPAAVPVPAFRLDDAVAGAAHGRAVRSKNVGPLVDAKAAPPPPGAPCA